MAQDTARTPETGDAPEAARPARTAPAADSATERRFTIPLAKMSLPAVPGRTDTKGIVSGLMLSLAMIGLLQFGERLDTALIGGLFPISGRVIAFTMIGLGTFMYGLVPGLIVAEINPLIATATGTSPIAPFFFITNALICLSALIGGRRYQNVISWKAVLTFTVLASVLLVLAYIPLHLFYFQLPVDRMLYLYTMQTLLSVPLPAIFLYAMLRVVRDAGFIEE
jgi:hypothetical protein